MFSFENEFLRIQIIRKGAELRSVYDKILDRELIWQADPFYWGKSSPILFPIVGALKEDTYYYKEQEFKLSRHGFARDNEFNVVYSDDSKIVFELQSSPLTKASYPFDFKLNITYCLSGKSLKVIYDVINVSTSEDLYFSIGGHPAFALGHSTAEFSNYKLIFNKDEVLKTTLLQDNLIQHYESVINLNKRSLSLDYKLFENDALVISEMLSDEIIVSNNNNGDLFKFYFENFPYFGLWTVLEANFLCLEPWSGVADTYNHNQQLTKKKGINYLKPMESWSANWNLKVL